MKKILVIGGVLALVAVIALVVVFMNLNGIVKKGVETVGPQITSTEIKLDAVNIMPFSGSGKLKGFFVGNPAGYKTPFLAKMGEVSVGLQLKSLKSDTIVIEEVAITNPEFTYEGGLSQNNLKKLLANIDSTTAAASKEKSPSGSERKLMIKDLTIKGAKVHFSFTGMGGKALSLPLPDIHLTNLGTENKGATVAQVVQAVTKEVVGSVDKIAVQAFNQIGKLGQDAVNSATKEAGKAVDKATDKVKGLFK
jgi:hypothetical protein